jgi:ABC-2 type transport system ATP-binding protein
MLTVSRLTRRFGTRVAVEDLSFSLAAGEIFALLGPNGAGKTTTLRMLGGLIAPSSGTVRVKDEMLSPANASRLRGRIGFLTEAPGLWERLSVRQNLLVYARLHGLDAPRRAVDSALDLFGIRDRGDDPAVQLSNGLKQRVALARTLLHDPDIVLLDEPTAGLDPGSARDLRETVVRLRSQGRAVLLSTHNLDEVERLADRVAVLRGRLVALDTPAALRARLFGSRVRITFTGPARVWTAVLQACGVADAVIDGHAVSIDLDRTGTTVPRLVRCLVEAGAEIVSVVPEEAPLEEVYLRLLDDGVDTAAESSP